MRSRVLRRWGEPDLLELPLVPFLLLFLLLPPLPRLFGLTVLPLPVLDDAATIDTLLISCTSSVKVVQFFASFVTSAGWGSSEAMIEGVVGFKICIRHVITHTTRHD